MTEHDVLLFVVGVLFAATVRSLFPRSQGMNTERLARVEHKLDQLLSHAGLASNAVLSPPRQIIGPAAGSPEVLQLIQQGMKIQAIKAYREQTGVGLKEAKDAVEELARRIR